MTMRNLVALGFFTLLVLSFQNCSPVSLSQVEMTKASLGSGDTSYQPISDSTEDIPAEESVPNSKGLVECEINHPNAKVTLMESLMPGSNAQASRICMSEHACLEVINEYAVQHDCSLNPGPATSPSSNGIQCTKIFPGSKGTCHNAQVLSDKQVADLLAKLAVR
ncbi:hypothetical protein ACLVWU_06305 [Bdellovibrio sp. HCB290]|uniref:hypothetical protein n=1 Tax=Bdellovibrio sp. HCB290 TaxID=3394356 RepID=UPI0039B64817